MIHTEISKTMLEKRLFNTNEAVQFVLDPDSDSDLSDLSDGEDQDITMKNIPARIRDEQEESNDGEKLAENSFIDESENEDQDDDEDDENENENVANAKTCEKFEPRWRKNKPPTPSYTFKGENVSLLPDDVGTWTPLSYFKMFWKHDLNVLLAEQTNIYSVEETGSSLNTTVE